MLNEEGFNNQIVRAYKDRDFQTVYEIATRVIESDSDRHRLADLWIYRGLAIGSLSDLQKPLISEMLDFIEIGVGLGTNQFSNKEIAVAIVNITNKFNASILIYYLSIIYAIKEQKPNTIIVQQPSSTKSISESIGAGLGAGIGAGIANSMIIRDEVKKKSDQLGSIYQKAYQKAIIRSLIYGWELDKTLPVAIVINDTVSKVFTSKCFLPEFKSIFKIQISPVTKGISEYYPNLTRPSF